MSRSLAIALAASIAAQFPSPAAMAAQAAAPKTSPAGRGKSPKTRVLETGARLLQGKAPLAGFDIYLDGFHPMKDEPERQMEAHHYCRQINEDFAQCVLFDGNTASANLNGVEYIISGKLFRTLPAAERRYWHPHNGEILSGQLVAPGIPGAAEHALMRKKIDSYGKTWHFWNTGDARHGGDRLPLGPPMLAWSFSRDGELQPALLQRRDRRLHVDTARTRAERQDLRHDAHPQAGVDTLRGRFARPTRAIPGVVDEDAPAGQVR